VADDDRTQNREEVDSYLYRARDAETGRGRGEETEAWHHFANESADLRVAVINIGGALAYALLDLADAIREHGRK
jgi:hypothetical protein